MQEQTPNTAVVRPGHGIRTYAGTVPVGVRYAAPVPSATGGGPIADVTGAADGQD